MRGIVLGLVVLAHLGLVGYPCHGFTDAAEVIHQTDLLSSHSVPHATLGNLLDRVLGHVAAVGATLGKQFITLVDHVLQASALGRCQLQAHGAEVGILVGLDRCHVYA